jgi:hypothetical protein
MSKILFVEQIASQQFRRSASIAEKYPSNQYRLAWM